MIFNRSAELRELKAKARQRDEAAELAEFYRETILKAVAIGKEHEYGDDALHTLDAVTSTLAAAVGAD